MADESSISRMVLSDQVKDRLLQAILDGRYPPGARIVETRVARELGTSQAPVREALRDLEALGLIETAAFRGARVRRPSGDELLEAFTVRAQLETLALRLATDRVAEEDLEQLRGDYEAMCRAALDNDVHAEAVADASFHSGIVAAAGNATLERVWEMLEPFSRTYITLVVPGADRQRIAELHGPILDALVRHDAAAGRSALDEHYRVVSSLLAGLWPAVETPASTNDDKGTR